MNFIISAFRQVDEKLSEIIFPSKCFIKKDQVAQIDSLNIRDAGCEWIPFSPGSDGERGRPCLINDKGSEGDSGVSRASRGQRSPTSACHFLRGFVWYRQQTVESPSPGLARLQSVRLIYSVGLYGIYLLEPYPSLHHSSGKMHLEENGNFLAGASACLTLSH